MASKKKQEVFFSEAEVDEMLKDSRDLVDIWFQASQDYRSQVRGQSRKLRNQREQLRMYQEKIELMRTGRGWLRTAGQILGVCR